MTLTTKRHKMVQEILEQVAIALEKQKAFQFRDEVTWKSSGSPYEQNTRHEEEGWDKAVAYVRALKTWIDSNEKKEKEQKLD
jgi:hypothetical protein